MLVKIFKTKLIRGKNPWHDDKGKENNFVSSIQFMTNIVAVLARNKSFNSKLILGQKKKKNNKKQPPA